MFPVFKSYTRFMNPAPGLYRYFIHPVFSILAFSIFTVFLFTGCKKKDTPLSATAFIISFAFNKADNPILTKDITGVRVRDTFYVALPAGVTERSLVPTILFDGKSISPASGIRRDFTNIVTYTVTAPNGNTKPFYIVLKNLSDEKRITRFVFEKSKNPSLTADLVGMINGAIIEIALPSPNMPASLIPTIEHTGVSISPDPSLPVQLGTLATFTVTAEDGSFMIYPVYDSYNYRVYAGSEDGYLYELNARTGFMLHRWYLGAPVQSNPMFHNGNLFACSGNGILYCIDTSTSTIKWTHQMDAMTGTNGAPIGYNGAIFYNDFAPVNVYSEGGVYSVDAATGARRWKKPREYALSLVMNNGIVYCGQRFYDLDAYDWNTGASIWGYGAPIGFSSNPCFWNNMLFADNELIDLEAVDLANLNTSKWRYWQGQLGGASLAPTIYDNKLYADNGPNINCLNPMSGAVLWKYTSSSSTFRPPVGMNGKIYANTKGGELIALNADNGSLVWKYGTHEISNPSQGQVTAANDVVIYGNWNNNILAFNATTGMPLWGYFGTKPFYSGILIVDNAGNQFHSAFSGNKQ